MEVACSEKEKKRPNYRARPVGILIFTVSLLVKLNIKENKLIGFGKGSSSMELISVVPTFDVLYK